MTAQNTPLVSVLVLCTSPRGHNDSSTEADSLQFPYILCGWFGQPISLPRVEAGVQLLLSLGQDEAFGCSSVPFHWVQTLSC